MGSPARGLLIGGLLAIFAWRWSNLPAPAPAGVDTLGLERTLPRDFSGHPDEAHRVSGVLAAIADYVEEDGRATPPQVTTVFAFHDLYQSAMSSPPWRAAVEHSPQLERAFAELGSKLGTGPEELDPQRRATAVMWLRAASASLEP